MVEQGVFGVEPLRRLPEQYELVVNVVLKEDTGGFSWGYYYIDHTTLSVFWLGEKDLHGELALAPGSLSPNHICMFLKALCY